jgi:hypothetical protein
VGSDDSLLTGDSIYGFTRKIWSPHIIENGIPADLDNTGRNSRLYLVLDDQEGIEDMNTTATPDSGKWHVSNHFYRWIAIVTDTCILLWRCYVNTVIDFMDIIHHPVFLFKNNFSDTELCIDPGSEIALSIGPNWVGFYMRTEITMPCVNHCF